MRLTNRLVSALFIVMGVCCVALGLEGSLRADLNCVQGAWTQPAECTEAHVEPAPNDRVLGDDGGCKFQNGSCSAEGSGCNSTPTFNNARKGTCQAYIGGCDIYQCAEDFFKTAVTLTKVVGACDSVNGDCGCRYSSAMPVETKTVEICNCKQQKV
jgi:hypothetical protein